MIEALKEVKDFQVALEVTAHKICQMMDWDYSEVWMVSENGKVLEFSPVGYGGESFEELRRISQELRFPANIDFAGRIWAEKNTQHIPDIFSEPNGTFMRAKSARNLD